MSRRTLEVAELANRSPLPVAARIGRLLVTSAITGRDASNAYPDDAPEQARNAFGRLRLALDAAGATPADLLSLRVYMRSLADRPALNDPWTELFPDPRDRPARHVVISDIAQFHERLRFQLEATIVLPRLPIRLARKLRRRVSGR